MRISDWSSDVCSSDLKSVPTFSHEALEARAVDLLERQRIEIDARHAAQVDRADLAAIWPLALGEGLRAAGGAEAVRDRVLVEVIIGQRVLARGQREDVGGQEREQRSEEHTSELQSLMRISYAVFCLKKKILSMIQNSYYI